MICTEALWGRSCCGNCKAALEAANLRPISARMYSPAHILDGCSDGTACLAARDKNTLVHFPVGLQFVLLGAHTGRAHA